MTSIHKIAIPNQRISILQKNIKMHSSLDFIVKLKCEPISQVKRLIQIHHNVLKVVSFASNNSFSYFIIIIYLLVNLLIKNKDNVGFANQNIQQLQ